jgi:hypothetical protein
MIRRIIFLSIAFAPLAGCNTDVRQKVSANPPPPVDEIDRIFRQTSPNAVNWDGKPGPDGLEVCVHLFRHSRDLPVTVGGALQFIIYEGVISEKDLSGAKPLRSWQFTGEELKAHRVRLMMGWGYAMRLNWGRTPPKASSVTLLVRYISPKGRIISASPLTIPIGPR